MKKSVRKANERLAKAIEYVNNTYDKYERLKSSERKIKQSNMKRCIKKATNSDVLLAVTKMEIMKIDKGNFRVVATYGGQEHVLDKKFKSTTKAQEWIDKHPNL